MTSVTRETARRASEEFMSRLDSAVTSDQRRPAGEPSSAGITFTQSRPGLRSWPPTGCPPGCRAADALLKTTPPGKDGCRRAGLMTHLSPLAQPLAFSLLRSGDASGQSVLISRRDADPTLPFLSPPSSSLSLPRIITSCPDPEATAAASLHQRARPHRAAPYSPGCYRLHPVVK